jgi:hypothetical protein
MQNTAFEQEMIVTIFSGLAKQTTRRDDCSGTGGDDEWVPQRALPSNPVSRMEVFSVRALPNLRLVEIFGTLLLSRFQLNQHQINRLRFILFMLICFMVALI